MSPEEFRASLSTKGVSAECPVCGAEDWRGLDDIVDLPVRMPGSTPSEAHVRIPGFEALAPSCGRCGNVRLIDLRWLQGPVRQRSEAEPETDQAEPSRPARQQLTNIWGQPISPRGGRER